jgi:hypothetical protein
MMRSDSPKNDTSVGDQFVGRFSKRRLTMTDKNNFLYPRSSYRGAVKPQNLVFNANLQEFSQRIGYICSLESNGKITPEESYQEIKSLWKQLKRSKKQLGIGHSASDDTEASE